MCGIVGMTGKRPAAGVVYERLKLLEYRGYDSAGIASLDGGSIACRKREGRVFALGGEIKHLHGSTAIGHTRWATHGKPSDVNAHPHLAGKFALVHNGIIENYAELKAQYFPDTTFVSQTDSEVIVRLLDRFYNGDVIATVKKVCDMLIGSYALVIICADFSGIVAAKKNNPAIIGYGKGENFIASDAPALAGLCEEITILQDGDIAIIEADSVTVFDCNLQTVLRERVKNLSAGTTFDLNGCPHYMLKEIYEVPRSIMRTAEAYPFAEGAVKSVIAGANRIIITGCGTAYNSGLVAKRYFEHFARIPTEVEIAGEFRYKNPVLTPQSVVIAISQSGETADTVEAAKLAQCMGAKVIAVTNSPYSYLTRIADAVVPVEAGQEICVAATKSYTGQLAALYLLAHTLAGGEISPASAKLASLCPLCEEVVKNSALSRLADMCARSSGVYFLGRDIDYAVALEGSLKLKEVSYVHSEGYPAGELKHGTLALIDIRTTSVLIATNPALEKKSINAAEQVLSRRGKVAIITHSKAIESAFAGRAEIIRIPPADEYLSPLLAAVALQLVAYKTAVLLDRNPDKPRNLAKSVTVE